MKILYILPGRYFKKGIGGATSHAIGLIDAFRRLGHEVIFTSATGIPYYDGNIEYRLLKIKELPVKKVNRLYKDYQVFKQLKKIIAEEKPHIIYIRWRHNLFWQYLLKNRSFRVIFECNTPTSLSIIRDDIRLNRFNGWLIMRGDRQICRYADIISAVSKEVKDYLTEEIKCSPEKVIINPNGVDTEKFNPQGKDKRKYLKIPEDFLVIGYAGAFRPIHGLETLIGAFQLLDTKKYRSARLVIIGTGDDDYFEYLRHLSEKNRSSDIIFTGPVPYNEMPSYLRTCDILISPQNPTTGSFYHQSPIKLYEYMASGRAVVASDIGQISRVIKDGYNGLLFKSGDHLELHDRIVELIEDNALREKISINARKDAEKNYSWDNNARRILDAVEK